MRNIALLFLLAAVSGCVGQTDFGSPGLSIASFKSDLETAYAGEELSIELRLDNSGDVPAKIDSIEILGIKLEDWLVSSTCDSLKGFMLPPKNFINCVYKLQAPDVPEGLKGTYRPKARVTYEYRTISATSIFIGPSADIRRIDDIKSLPSKKETTLSPVAIDVEARNPIRLSQGSVSFPVAIKIINRGGGVICNGPCNPGTWHKITLRITSSSNVRVEGESCGQDASGRILTLYKGQENELICSLIATPSASGTGESLIIVESDYGYITERETAITVSKRAFA